ncbi:TPA_asm: P [Zea alphacytorhabdovirus 1]|nr:TPA_asm: P [Zea alphacytorhabdovirus 1]
MDPPNFIDLPNPVFDLKMSGLGEDPVDDPENGLPTDKETAPSIHESNKESMFNSGTWSHNDSGEIEDEDLAYDPANVQLALEDLQFLCDKMGLSYTTPMENQVKAMFREEPICYSHLVWYLRGIIIANQTQIIPTITSAISDMKMETRNLQQSSNKINKETTSLEKIAKEIVKDIASVENDIQQSFRDSMKLFMDEMATKNSNRDPPVCSEPTPKQPTKIAELSSVKNKKAMDDTVYESPAENRTDIPSPSHSSVIRDQYLAEKLKALIRYGIDPTFLKTAPPSIIDAMYPDNVHSQLKNVKLTPAMKTKIRANLEERLEEIADSDEEE